MIIRGVLSITARVIDSITASGRRITQSGLDPYCDLTADGVHLLDTDDKQIRALL